VSILNAVSSIDDDRSREVLTRLANDESADTYIRETATSALSRLDLVRSRLGQFKNETGDGDSSNVDQKSSSGNV
jgi:HEAT repeat protein